jgi:phenylpropionate dioxygenase-like ring-hydroxylating dioxygenase large terminal subunit
VPTTTCAGTVAPKCQGAGQIKKSIVCPYHRWSYDIDGCLLHIPQRKEFEGPIDYSELGLRRARLEAFKGTVFVHPEAEGESLATWLGDFPKYHGPYEPERLIEVSSESFALNCNWKTYLENHQDGYHLEYVHAKTLDGYEHHKQAHNFYRRNWSFHEPISRGITVAAQARVPWPGGRGTSTPAGFPSRAQSAASGSRYASPAASPAGRT